MKIKTKKRRAVTSIGIVAIAAIMIGSVAAFEYAEAKKHNLTNDPKGANKTVIGEPLLNVIPDMASWKTIIAGTIKTSTNSDLIITHFQECAIHTGLKLDIQNENLSSVVRENVRLLIDDVVVPASFGENATDNDEVDGTFGVVTMCSRAYSIDTNVLSTLNATCQAGIGPCPTDIFFDSYIRTKQTHGWQWIVLNAGYNSDVNDHVVQVQARTFTTLHPYGFVDRIAKQVPFEIGITLDKALEQEDELAGAATGCG